MSEQMGTRKGPTFFEYLRVQTKRYPHLLIPLYFAIAALLIYMIGVAALGGSKVGSSQTSSAPPPLPTPTPTRTPRPSPTPTQFILRPTPIATGIPGSGSGGAIEPSAPVGSGGGQGGAPTVGAGTGTAPGPAETPAPRPPVPPATPVPGAPPTLTPAPIPTPGPGTPRPTATPIPARPTPAPVPEADRPGRIRPGIEGAEATFVEEGKSNAVTFTRQINTNKCQVSRDYKEIGPDGSLRKGVRYVYVDNGCDGKLDSFWDPLPVSRDSTTESRFQALDREYRTWLILLSMWEFTGS